MVRRSSRLQSKTSTPMPIPDLEASPLGLQVGLRSTEPAVEPPTTQPIGLTVSEESSDEGVEAWKKLTALANIQPRQPQDKPRQPQDLKRSKLRILAMHMTSGLMDAGQKGPSGTDGPRSPADQLAPLPLDFPEVVPEGQLGVQSPADQSTTPPPDSSSDFEFEQTHQEHNPPECHPTRIVTPPEILESDLSGTEYVPSDVPGGPARLRRKKKEKVGEKVDSSRIDPNEKDEAQRRTIHLDQVDYEKRKADLQEWIEVIKSLGVLGNERQLNEKVICNITLDRWWDVRFTPGKRPIYLQFTTVHYLSFEILAKGLPFDGWFEGDLFRGMYQSVASREEDKRVCFFLHRNQAAMDSGKRDSMEHPNHFFTVLFDYDAHSAHVFGIHNAKPPNVRVERAEGSRWACWLGPELWQIVGEGMGWRRNVGDPKTVLLVTKNWQQNGYDCGMYSLEILRRLTKPDQEEKLLNQTDLVGFSLCQHKERMELLNGVGEWLYSAQALYRKLYKDGEDQIPAGDLPALVFTHVRQKTFHAIDQFRTVEINLRRSLMTCGNCAARRGQAKRKLEGPQVDHGLVLKRPKPRQTGAGEEEKEREPGELSDGETEAELNPRRALLEVAQRLGGEVVERRNEAKKNKSVQPYQFPEGRPHGVVKQFDPWFDSYDTGPTAEDVVEMYTEVYAAYQASPASARCITVGSRFSDHGYRRTTGGFHQFYLNDPSEDDQLAHFFPLPPEDVVKAWKKRRTLERMDLTLLANSERLDPLPPAMIKGNDLEVWTLKKMVQAGAGLEGTEKGMKIYVNGRTESNSLIRLDINGSRNPVKLETLQFSADIDSVIWQTDRLKTLGSINLHLLPFKGDKAPISKHNHTYVQLYWPRTEEDVKKGERSTASQEVPVSNLPNTHFAHFGKTEGSAEVLVVFPRMKHKHPLRKKWETKIPYEIEVVWLEHVLYPALRRVKGRGIQPYTDWALDDTLYKNRGAMDKTILLSPKQLNEVQDAIHAILRENEDDEEKDFSPFGSLFFVLQIIGIKVSTSQDYNWAYLWDKLVRQQPNLDWDYMADTENGELLLDLGIGIHPLDSEGVVGFWDIDALRVGFDYGGYNKGTTHGVSTVPTIGGIHAEMGVTRRMWTHIAYRLTYNLVYEVLRGKQTRLRDGFFPTRLAYDLDHKYRQGINDVVEAYQRNIHKSFGVRDEYRCRASSMKKLLPRLRHKANEYIKNLDPIIWLSTIDWFRFVQRRVKEMSNFQEKLYLFKHPVENYGVLTSILTHIIQHVGITPIVMDPDLRYNLKVLHFEAISSRFGCFFLHDLDLANGKLKEVQQKDPPQMLVRMGIKSAQKRRGKSPDPELLPSQDSLTWKELGLLVNSEGDSRARIRNFVWDPLWLAYSDARALFCDFTYQYWMLMGDKVFIQLTEVPPTLEQAMKLWTLKSVKDRLLPKFNYHLMPSADGLDNNVPVKSRGQLFNRKRTAFFPEPDGPITNPGWKLFCEVGYVKDYHTAIESSSEGGKRIKDALDGIFANLQILPFNPGRPSDAKMLWRWTGNDLELLINSSYIQLLDRTLRYKGGKGKERRQGGKHKIRSPAEMMKVVFREKKLQLPLKKTKAVQKFTAIETQELMRGRRGKPKNYRAPPTRGKKVALEPEEESSESDQALKDVQKLTRQRKRLIVESDSDSAVGEGDGGGVDLPPINRLEEGYESDCEEEEF